MYITQQILIWSTVNWILLIDYNVNFTLDVFTDTKFYGSSLYTYILLSVYNDFKFEFKAIL